MKLTHLAIERPRVVFIGCLLVAAMSAWALVDISVQRTPAISKAIVMVSVPFPGAEPREVESQVTRKIEQRLQRLEDVDFISSSSMRGVSVTQVMFLDGVDPDEARGRVTDIVEEARGELPLGREVVPGVNKIDFDNTPLLLVNLQAPKNFDERALKTIAEEVQDELDPVSGVSGSQIFGGREREVHVDVDLDRAREYGVTINDCRDALQEFHSELPGGSLDTGEMNPQILSETRFRTVDDIRQAVVREEEGRVIRISDVATVSDTYRRTQNVAQLDGRDCATILVYKENDVNTLATVQRVKQKVAELEGKYPFIQFSTTRDTSEEIQLMFRVLGSSFVFGAMLVLVILGWAMGLRISILVLLAIPFSSGVALACLYFLSIPISNMVIFAFILAVGMVVDGAIIVAENIHRHIERGLPPVEAAKVGIDEVGMPVIMADLTTIAAYLPMLLVPGIMGDFMGVMPVVVCVALIGSILVDHFVIPTIAAYWYGRGDMPDEEEIAIAEQIEEQTHLHTRPNLGLGTQIYQRILHWSLAHRYAVMTCAALAIAWAIVMAGKIGTEFFPAGDRGQFEIVYELPLGSSIEQTLAASKLFTEPIEELKAEDARAGETTFVNYVSAIGSSEGLASRLENDPAVGPEFGKIMVQLLSPLDREVHEQVVIARLRAKIEERVIEYPGIKYKIEAVEEGPPGGYDVGVRISGENHEQLGEVASKIMQQLEEVPHTFDVGMDYRPESPAVRYRPNPYVLPFYQISEAQINRALFTAVNGDNSILLNMNDEDVALRIQAAPKFRRVGANLDRMTVRGQTGKIAPIAELCEVDHTQGIFAVNRYENKPAVTARCDVDKDKVDSQEVFRILRETVLAEQGFVPAGGESILESGPVMKMIGTPGTPSEGMRIKFVGEQEEFQSNFKSLWYTMIIAVVLIFAILVIQFNSFRQAIVVILTVPFSFIGVIGGSWLFGFPFSLATFIGLVSLAGVVVNDAIVVVDFINQSRRRGLSIREAVEEAGINRLRPVLLTTITTIGGLLPLFLNIAGGAEFWQPLCGAIIFGLGFATVLTLVVVPVVYTLIYGGTFETENAAA